MQTTQTQADPGKAKRKRHDPTFKARVALEALKGVKTVQQLAKEFDIHPVQISDWKKRLSTHAGSVFGGGATKQQEDFGAERTELHSKIGELTVMLDFAVKKIQAFKDWWLTDAAKKWRTPLVKTTRSHLLPGAVKVPVGITPARLLETFQHNALWPILIILCLAALAAILGFTKLRR